MRLERGLLELGDLAVGGERGLKPRTLTLDRQTVHVFSDGQVAAWLEEFGHPKG
jgi:hypothetical protein